MSNDSKRILEEAMDIVGGERQENYGDIHTSFGQIADYWSVYVQRKFQKHALDIYGIDIGEDDPLFTITEMDVANLMILLKVSRAQNNFDRDSYVDIAGYVACAETLGEL